MKKIKTIERFELIKSYINVTYTIILGIICLIFLFFVLIGSNALALFPFIIVLYYFFFKFLTKYLTETETTNKTYQINTNNLIEISFINFNKNSKDAKDTICEYYVDYITLLINNRKYKINNRQFVFLHNSSNSSFLTFTKRKYFDKSLIINNFFISKELIELFEKSFNENSN